MLKALLKRPLSIPLGVVGAGAATQLPQAYNQYAQYLQGRVDEAELVAGQAQARIDDFVQTYGVSTVDAVRQELSGESGRSARMAENDLNLFEGQVERFAWLQQTIADLGEGLPVIRFGEFLTKLEPEFVEGTMKQFQPGLPASFNAVTMGEIAVIALIGFAIFYVLTRLCEKGVGKAVRGKGKK